MKPDPAYIVLAILAVVFLAILAAEIQRDNPPNHEPRNPEYQENGR